MQRGTREYAVWSIGILIVLVFALVPVLWILSLSFKESGSIASGESVIGTFWPEDFTLENYETLFTGGISESPFIAPLINSILIAIIATSISIVLAAFCAYAIARLEFPGKALILA